MSELSRIPNNVSSDEIEKFMNIWAREQVIRNKITKLMTEKFREIETKNKLVKTINMSNDDFEILIKYLPKELFDLESLRSNIERGIRGKLWGATVCVNPQYTEMEFLTDSEQ